MTAEYSVIRYSPSPEVIEHVNVALVFWGHPKPRVVFDPQFPRLNCLAPGVDSAFLEFYLRDLKDRLVDPSNHQMHSAQFELSKPRQITDPVGSDLEKTLRAKFLHRRPLSAATGAQTKTEYVDTALHEFLVKQVGVAERDIKRRAIPADFLSAAVVERHFSENGVSVSRVLVGARSLVVADSVNRWLRSIRQIEQRASRIGLAFFRLGKAREDILRIDGRQLHRAIVFFGKPRPGTAARLEYVEETLKRDADYPVEAGNPTREFIEIARRATQGLF